MQKPLIIAHRGDSSHALENSLEAFRLALAVPVDMIELDVRKSGDDVLYVMHDRETGRTADRNIDVEQALSKEIAGLKLRNGERIPTLDEVFQLVNGRTAVNVEIKSDGAGELLARHLAEHPFRGKLAVSSFKEAEVAAVRRAYPDLDVSAIYDTFSPRHVADYRAKGYRLLSLRKNTVTEPLVRACHAHGLRLFIWTVDDEDEMKRCIEWEVDGIYTNRPGVLKDLVDRQRASGF